MSWTVSVMGSFQVVQSKLIPPVPSAMYMRRSSLIKKLGISQRVKLSILHSGAGYGKSSGLAQYFSDSRSLFTWYTVTDEDDDIIPFLAHVQESIRRIVPTFGYSLKHWLSPSSYPKEEDLQQWLALFINECCEIDEPVSIVIDDFHLVDHVFHINYMMEKIVEFLPPHIHIIVASRSRPRWTNLLKLKLNDQLLEIVEKDFIFSEEEISVFYEDYFNRNITNQEAEKIVELTEGWAIAINLLAMQMTQSELQFTGVMKPALQDLFGYLSEEVYQQMSAEEQYWLLAFAIFPAFSEQLISEFYSEEATHILQKLAVRHVFIQPLGEKGSYRYHALFQQFLENKWLEEEMGRFISLQKQAAIYYDERENPIQALFHATKTKDDRFIANMLVNTSSSLIKSGQFDWFLDVLNALDPAITEEMYSLLYYEGEVHRYRAFYEKARQAYVRCKNQALLNNDAYYMSKANAGLAHIFLDTIQPGLAEPYLKEAIDWAQKSTQSTLREMEMLKRQFAENLVNLGKAKDAAEWVKEEQLGSNVLSSGNLDARIALRMGKLSLAEKILNERYVEGSALPDSHRETEVLLALIYSMTGKSQLALKSAEKGIQIGQIEKSAFSEAVGWIRLGHAEILMDPFDLQKPEQYYLQSIKKMDELNVSRGKAEPYMGLSILKARQGLFQEAVLYGESALRETELVNDEWLSGLIRVSLSIVHFYHQEWQQSEMHAVKAKAIFSICGDVFGEMISAFWLMNIYEANEQEVDFYTAADLFSRICVKNDFFFFLEADTMFGPFDRQSIYPLFLKAWKLYPDHAELQEIVKKLNLQMKTDHPGYRIYARILGPLHMYRGIDDASEENWQRDKAKELFVYFLLNKDRYIPKEEMMREIWNEVDGKSADRDFKVALNALLKVLEPSRPARKESFFILRKQTMYRLNPDADIRSDVDLFLQFANKGLQAFDPDESFENLLKAASFYKGELFEEKHGADWIIQERAELERTFIQVLERLAQNYIRTRQFGKTIYLAEKLLRIDRTWEEAYRLLMIAYYHLQNRPQSVKWYGQCEKTLKEELNIEPMETTKQMYEMIIGQD